MTKLYFLPLPQLLPGDDPAEGGSDDQLLQTFTRTRDEASFATLARRHGSRVLAVCRRVLGNSHDAEDAFQAAFLLLARKAHTVRKGTSLASWLYSVAYRVALDARQRDARRLARELPASTISSAEQLEAVAPPLGPYEEEQETQRALMEEVQRLPDKYRIPLRFCYLEGKTNEQAAQLLGCPSGTVHSRLARARVLLRQRMVRRGGRPTSRPLIMV